MKITATEFGFVLRHYRRWAGLSEQQAAARAGFKDASAWTRYETGRRPPPSLPRTMHALAKAVATDVTPEEVKYEMLCRSARKLDMLDLPVRPTVGLPRHLPPERPLPPGYLLSDSNRVGVMAQIKNGVAPSAFRSIRKAGYTQDDVLTRLDDVVQGAFPTAVSYYLKDDSFAAFLEAGLQTHAVVVNPDLTRAQKREAMAHELAHLLLMETFVKEFEFGRLDTILGSRLFEDPMAERFVSWLAAILLIPQPLTEREPVRLSVDLVEDLAKRYDVPPELALCRLRFCMQTDYYGSLSVRDAASLVHQYPRIFWYW